MNVCHVSFGVMDKQIAATAQMNGTVVSYMDWIQIGEAGKKVGKRRGRKNSVLSVAVQRYK